MGVFSESAHRKLCGHWASSQTLRREQNRRRGVFSNSRQRTIWSLGEFSDSAKRAESANGSFLRVCRQRTIWSLGEFSDSAKKAESATGSFLRVCRQRTTWSLGRDLRLCQESRIGEWEFSQSPPTANYVVIGASSQTLLGQQNPAGGFLRVCRQRTYMVIGRVLRLCQESRIGDWEFSQSPPTANYMVIGARSQTLRREQNRQTAVFSNYADRELCGDWGEFSDSAQKAE